MQDNDLSFISQVVDFYYGTVDADHPQGNMSAVAANFGITRAKVNKILITAGVIDSLLYQAVMRLKARGYATEDIVAVLGVSAATVKINMPYEKVIYNGKVKSAGAGYMERFRQREAILLENQRRKSTEVEVAREFKRYEADQLILKPRYGDYLMEKRWKDDLVHLKPCFIEERFKLFKITPDLMVLHIELDADLGEVQELAKLKYGKSLSRDILVPKDMPLHNLHYAIQQLFGFANYHLHVFKLNDEDLRWVTNGSVAKWKKLIGFAFRNPIRDELIDAWDDDYAGGSAKKYMRSKYTGPLYKKIFEESYLFIRSMVDGMKVYSKSLKELLREFELNPFGVNETVPVGQILSCDGHSEYKSVKAYYDCVKESILEARRYPENDMRSQPFVHTFASTLTYEYDYGDGWSFTITPHKDAEYLVKQGRLTAKEMREAIKEVCTSARPAVLALDGLPLVEDVGGVQGYMDFLRGINGLPSDMYEDKEESLAWAKSLGWKSRVHRKTLL